MLFRSSDVLEIVLVGNPIMHHLFLGLDPTPLGVAPFTLATDGAVRMKSSEIHMDAHPGARIYVLPCIAGHVGADAAAMLLSEGPARSEEIQLLVDVGTNAEIVFAHVDKTRPEAAAIDQKNFVFNMKLLGVMEVGQAGDGSEPAIRLAYAAISHPSPEVRRLACEHLAAHADPEHAAVLDRAAPGAPDEAGGVAVVDHDQGIVTVRKITDLIESGYIAIHTEHGVSKD